MVPLKLLFMSLMGLYFMTLVFLLMQRTDSKRELPGVSQMNEFLAIDRTYGKPGYKFIDPVLAYKVLSKFDEYKPVEGFGPKQIKKSFLGLKIDDNYCDKHRAHFVEYPESVFEQMNVIHGAIKGSFIADTVSSVGNDLHSHLLKKMTKTQKESFIHEIKPEANNFFTSLSFSIFFDLTKHLSCLSQETSQVPGQTKLSRKELVAGAAMEYVKKYEDRPHCVNYEKLFPENWLLTDASQCKEFFKKILSPEYERLKQERKIVYMKKAPGRHRGEGVDPFTLEEELKLREEYKDGALCGKRKNQILMQHYIHNSLLLNGHKFDFRMYMLIASVNPLIVYYHDGFLRVTLAKYDANSNDKKVLLTNLALNKQIYDEAEKGNKYDGKDPEELKLAQQWSFDRLQEYLLNAGIISDPNWLNNYLRPEFKKAMIHLIRLSSDGYLKHSSFYALYGVDFMLDTNLNLWFIEANSGPAFDGYSQPMGKFVGKVLTDHLEIVFGLLRSRMKRVVDFINQMTEDGDVREKVGGGLIIQDFEEKKEIFERITRNYFEDEFKVGKENGFEKIIDENEEGINVYQGYLERDCL